MSDSNNRQRPFLPRSRSATATRSSDKSPLLPPLNTNQPRSSNKPRLLSPQVHDSSADDNGYFALKRSRSHAGSTPSSPKAGPSSQDFESNLRNRAFNSLKQYDSPDNISPGGTQRPQSPSRVPSSTYAPVRTPSSTSLNQRLNRHSRSSGSASVSTVSSTSSEDRKQQAQYLAQEKAYLQKIKNDIWDDYYVKGVQEISMNNIDNTPEYDSDDDDSLSDVMDGMQGFGGVGTSFDDEYTDIGSSYPLLENSFTHEEIDSNPELKERLEWQSMLSSVLTGEVFRSEKKRLRAPDNGRIINGDELWLELRAKLYGRTVAEQRQILDTARAGVDQTVIKVNQFKLHYDGSQSGLEQANRQVTQMLKEYYACVSLYPTRRTMIESHKICQNPDTMRRIDALNAWESVTTSIHMELDLLRTWTGNSDIDPMRRPAKDPNDKMDEKSSLVENVLKQDDLTAIFEYRINHTFGPLITKAKETTIEYSDAFIELGLPLFHSGLSVLIAFPITLIQEIIRMRLSYARKLINPTMMIIDQMINDFENYLRIAFMVMQKNADYTAPILDKGWNFRNFMEKSFDSILLDCVGFYLELFHKKMLENSRESKVALPVGFRAFKDGEQLEQQYAFLRDLCKYVEGGDLLVAREFTALNSTMLARLLTYWEGQLPGPPTWTAPDIEKWYGASMGNVRSLQRRLLRFYRIHSEAYQNASEYIIQPTKVKYLMDCLRESGHFLVLTGAFEQYGIYVIANPSMANRPEKIKALITGYLRPGARQNNRIVNVPYVLLFCIKEPLIWEGDILNLEMSYFDVDVKPGRMRLVAGGGRPELEAARNTLGEICGGREFFDIVADSKSHLSRVDHELNRVRKLFFRLSISVINGVQTIRQKCRPYGCQETVNNLFVFAREFSQRGTAIMDANRRGTVAMRLINLCIEWVSFVCDDCAPTDYKTFRWTVVALEFAMVMTRGVNIVAISSEQFTKLRLKVAACMSLLISHFDIMGARSKAAQEKSGKITSSNQIQGLDTPLAAVDNDMILAAALREDRLKRIHELEEEREGRHFVGKVLDDTTADSQFLTYLASSFSNVSIRWQQGRFIGGGTFGAVYAAVNLDTGGVMAVKEIRLQDSQSIRHILKSIKDEMTVLEILNHPNIVQYYGVEVHRDKVFIFMENCQGGSLSGLLEYGSIEDEQVIQVYTLQMLEGLAYLHKSGIVHRDIKPENILLDHMGVVKFVDFGAAKVIARTGKTRHGSTTASISIGAKTKLNSMTGTPMYMSPEAITGADSGRAGAIDIWSLGCCVLEMATGRRPWANLDNEWAIMYRIAAGHLPNMPTPEQLSEDGRKFLMRCFERDPKKRPSAVELLNDPWIVSIRNIVLGSIIGIDESISSPGSAGSSPCVRSPQTLAAKIMDIPEEMEEKELLKEGRGRDGSEKGGGEEGGAEGLLMVKEDGKSPINSLKILGDGVKVKKDEVITGDGAKVGKEGLSVENDETAIRVEDTAVKRNDTRKDDMTVKRDDTPTINRDDTPTTTNDSTITMHDSIKTTDVMKPNNLPTIKRDDRIND